MTVYRYGGTPPSFDPPEPPEPEEVPAELHVCAHCALWVRCPCGCGAGWCEVGKEYTEEDEGDDCYAWFSRMM